MHNVGMLDTLNLAIATYKSKWDALIAQSRDQRFFEGLRPTGVGWKVEDFAELQRKFHQLRDYCDQIHWGWLNERWLVTMHLREDDKLALSVKVIKLMQRRPNSKDVVGLDHMDFLIPESADAKAVLATEKDLKWTEETNGDFCKWISIWFDGTEAKLRSDTTLDVCIAEMQDINERIKKR